MTAPVTLADLVTAYAERLEANAEYVRWIGAEDRSTVVGVERGQEVRRNVQRAIARRMQATGQVELLLEQAYHEALAHDRAGEAP